MGSIIMMAHSLNLMEKVCNFKQLNELMFPIQILMSVLPDHARMEVSVLMEPMAILAYVQLDILESTVKQVSLNKVGSST